MVPGLPTEKGCSPGPPFVSGNISVRDTSSQGISGQDASVTGGWCETQGVLLWPKPPVTLRRHASKSPIASTHPEQSCQFIALTLARRSATAPPPTAGGCSAAQSPPSHYQMHPCPLIHNAGLVASYTTLDFILFPWPEIPEYVYL